MEDESEKLTIIFNVIIEKQSISPHEVYVVGNIKELGEWNSKDGLKMDQASESQFEASIIVPKNMPHNIEYKYAIFSPREAKEMELEQGENRKISAKNSENLFLRDRYCVCYIIICN